MSKAGHRTANLLTLSAESLHNYLFLADLDCPDVEKVLENVRTAYVEFEILNYVKLRYLLVPLHSISILFLRLPL